MKRWAMILVCLMALLYIGFGNIAMSVGAMGNTYYVAKTGLDSNDGSLAHPWLTINHAASTAVAGDTVYVRSGTYNEYVFDCYHSGTAGNPITFENYPGESPIIDGTGLANPSSNYGLLYIVGNYINWQGFEIRNSLIYEGVYALHAFQVNLSNLKIHAINGSGIALGDCSNMVIDTCELYNCNTNPQYDETIILSPAQNIEIKNCYIHDTGSAGIDCKGANGDSGCNNISIHNNEICNLANGSSGIYIDMQGINQNGFSIYCNKIHNCGNAITLGSEGNAATLTNTNIYNNLIYNNTYGFQVQPYSFPKTVSIINNTFYNNLIGLGWDDTAANYQVNCVVRNNIVVSTTTYSLIHYDYYAQGGVTIDHNLFYDAAGYNTQYGTNYVIGNPLLTNPTTDFSIPSNSPAVDAGSSANAPGTDYVGTVRPQNTGYDIGAYEQVPLSITTNNLPNGSVGVAYSQTLIATSGATPYTWSIASGTLPTGLSLSSGGVISGTPTTASGPTIVTFQVTDIASLNATKVLTITIGSSPSITTGTLANGIVGIAYSQTLTATGGTTPYTWSITSGTLPVGISLSSGGVISGTPTTTGGPISVTFKVTDNIGANATKSIPITVANATWDINKDGAVNIRDMTSISQHWGETGTPGWIPQDVNNDGIINSLDMIIVGQHWTP
jgi:hypothetical protein